MSEPQEVAIRELQEEVRRLAEAQRRQSRLRAGVLGALVLLGAGVALAQPAITTFGPDLPALASQVNGNFDQLAQFAVPRGAVIFVDGPCPANTALPDGGVRVNYTQVAQGRAIVGLPAGGTLGQPFGTAMTGNTPPVHSHTTTAAGSHNHGGLTGSFGGWVQGTVNWAVQPGFDSPWHHVHGIGFDGNHTHPLSDISASAVIPYVFYTACKKL